MNSSKSKENIASFIALLSLCVFALCILSALLAGAGAYKRLTQRNDAAFASRTATQYIATKLRQAENGSAVSTVPFGEGDAVCVSEEIGGKSYITYIYCHEGSLCELYTAAGNTPTPHAGEKLLPAENLRAVHRGNMLTVIVNTAAGERTVCFALRGCEG